MTSAGLPICSLILLCFSWQPSKVFSRSKLFFFFRASSLFTSYFINKMSAT